MNPVVLEARDGARAEIFPHGAHLTSWIPAGGEEQLFLSRSSEFAPGAAIRGGVPIVFPQFSGLGSLPKHGFARTAEWRLVRAGQDEHGVAQAVFELQENIARLMIWPQVFHAEYTVTLSGQHLRLDFTVHNSGDTSFSFTTALHTYFQVRDLSNTAILGLAGLAYRDTVLHNVMGRQDTEELHIDQEIDRIYANIARPIIIEQSHQRAVITQTGFKDAVVWNPGAEKNASMADLETDGYQRMVCVEAAQIFQVIQLAPGKSWTGSQSVEITPR